jgi:hypothetical protein
MELQDAGCRVKYLIRDRDGKYPTMFDTILADAGITVVQHRCPNTPDERDHGTLVRTRRRELLDRTLILNQRHVLHALREYEVFYNTHRPHQGIANDRPLARLPGPITDHRSARRDGRRGRADRHRPDPPAPGRVAGARAVLNGGKRPFRTHIGRSTSPDDALFTTYLPGT